uniref:SKP1-like protein n=1 Tax=Chromera velia CCMP2878 TaxID=1169474 RepID=A0A0G4HNL3_9ALVE|mmetsp:Transcript_20152/g.40442  ORF Transcript_20152/g.40442 Transcript_20152/m.40442 type:complete len:174 (+) Transcript_20152:117-638(+)|eukprot:Cvel_7660.t1-p1 / transcript=Cvel_7660.t1 / gene=Cvel_7660 / organism=Chromera_velia_CCMP2878 / gene_product=S-phase kinase-associated protein 1, putative / transcript_product=S-phase kinase-associated protein 1, putative / location=Cvel_scaffold406:16672-21045(-) / protein_length=173 / sequence_SO=supercontig / SO=protein_coding / is_pseudo=false
MDQHDLLKLSSSNGQIFQVEPAVACMSKLISNMHEDNATNDTIPLPRIKPHTLKKVIDYCSHHKDNPGRPVEEPIKPKEMTEVATEWDAEFIDVKLDTIFELLLAANFLDIQGLLDLCCLKMASLTKGKTPQQVRELFKLSDADFTPEEDAALRAEATWKEEDDCEMEDIIPN